MNEIITKLDEIEGKADAIILDAKLRKEQMAAQLEQDKKEIDAKYDTLEQRKANELERELKIKAEQQITARRQQGKEALERLEAEFEEKKEVFAEEIFGRIIQA